MNISFSDDLKEQIEREAKKQGVTFDVFVLRSVEWSLKNKPFNDPFYSDTSTYDGDVPSDLSENHDDYLYGDKS